MSILLKTLPQTLAIIFKAFIEPGMVVCAVIPLLKRQRLEDYRKFKVNLVYTVRLFQKAEKEA